MNKKKLIVWDLDNTLINYNPTTNKIHTRPYLTTALDHCVQRNYDMAVWSLGSPEYVKMIVETTLKNYDFVFVWNREYSTKVNGYGHIKLLDNIYSTFKEYDNTNTVLVDDQANHKFFNMENVIPVNMYTSQSINDNTLFKIKDYLGSLRDKQDVRKIINKLNIDNDIFSNLGNNW